MKAELLGSTAWPERPEPEVAFAGRSNVGKSSLINCLVQRRGLARTSKSPGRTRELVFFGVADRVTFTDLPGYGYAKVSKAERASWAPKVERYLAERDRLALVLLLQDSRRDPGDEERQFLDWLDEQGRPVAVIATKIDKLKRSQRHPRLTAIARSLALELDQVVPFSSKTREGRLELWDLIDSTIAAHRAG